MSYRENGPAIVAALALVRITALAALAQGRAAQGLAHNGGVRPLRLPKQ